MPLPFQQQRLQAAATSSFKRLPAAATSSDFKQQRLQAPRSQAAATSSSSDFKQQRLQATSSSSYFKRLPAAATFKRLQAAATSRSMHIKLILHKPA
eukprot:2324370-Amphidinium_carterae.1